MDRKVVLKGLPPDHPLHAMVREAKMKEWNSFNQNKVLSPISRADFLQEVRETPVGKLPLRWVLEWKIIDGKVDIKARLVAQGTKGMDRREGVLTEVALPHHRALRALMIWQLAQPKWDPEASMLQGDLKTAFLQTENLSDMVFVQMPRDPGCTTEADWKLVRSMFGPDGIARAVKTLYGTRDAPANLDVVVRRSLLQRNFKECLTCPNLYRRFTVKGYKHADFEKLPEAERKRLIAERGLVIDSWVFVYVDDLLIGTGETWASAVAKEIQLRWRFKEPPAPPSRFLGIQLQVLKHGVFWDQKPLAEALARLVDPALLKGAFQLPLPRQTHVLEDKIDQEVREGKVLGEKSHRQYRSILGMLAYLQHTRIDLLYSISFFGQYGAGPTPIAMKHLQCAAVFASQTADYGLSFPRPSHAHLLGDFSRVHPSEKSHQEGWNPIEERAWHFDVFSDATYRQGKEKALSGYVVCLNKQVVAMRACKQRRRAHSSTRAELLTLYDTVDIMLAMRLLLLEFGIFPRDVSVNVWCDSADVVHGVQRQNPQCTEETSVILARQLRDVFRSQYTEDAFRLTFPRAADLLEASEALEDVTVVNVGDGVNARFREPSGLTASQLFPGLDAGDIVQCESISDRLRDGSMALVHIDGVNQLADGLTKMDVSIDYVGRLVHRRSDFESGSRTAIRDESGPVRFLFDCSLSVFAVSPFFFRIDTHV